MALMPGQQRCVDTLDRSIVVAAGAGSGKTFTLTERIVRAIQTGQVDGIGRVCAITFTNKAATELKSRIKARLRAVGLSEQALGVDEAWVSTIHGMCARIIRAHALELGIDPAFGMADSAQVARMRADAVEEVLRRAQAGVLEGVDGNSLNALFAEYPARSAGPRGLSVESMLTLLMERAGASPSGFECFAVPAMSAKPAALASGVLDAFAALIAATRAQKPSESREAWAAEAERAIGQASEALLQGDVDAAGALRLLDRIPLPKKTGTADYKQQVADALRVQRMSVMELRLAAARPHLATLVLLARESQELFADAKRSAGVLDNNDLLVVASRAITGHPGIAERYADKFQLVMVDEFQDTDQLQVDMIKLLAGPGARRLCTVGDAQQSIYRFRGADVSVYRRHVASVRAGNPDDVILLPDNFRSHADVLSFVDRVFERDDMFGGEFMSLAAGRDESRVERPFAQGVPRISVQLTSNEVRGAGSADVRAVAAARIASSFADLRERGHAAGEMAVLLGGMTHAGLYADALRERGLACVVSGGSVFADTLEAKLVCEMVRVAANPGQTQALYNVLASPLFGLSAGDLLQLATVPDDRDGLPARRNLFAGLSALAREASEGAPGRLRSPQLELALRVMGDFLAGAGKEPASQLVMRAVVDSGWLSRLESLGPEGLAQAGNVYKAIRMVQSAETSGAAGPAQVARLFQDMLASSKEAPGALSATGGDFVRIMTVHASKGLEFPIVAVAELADGGTSASRLIASDVDGTTYLSLDAGNTAAELKGSANVRDLPGLYASLMGDCADEDELARAVKRAESAYALRAALHERDRMGDAEEAKRLLYVALTRSKEALVVSLRGRRTKDNPNATPKGCTGAVVRALAGEDGFAVGRASYDYGGSLPAAVEHVAVEQLQDGHRAGGAQAIGRQRPGVEAEPFLIPLAEPRIPVERIPFSPLREGVFSYSSIAEASHEGDALYMLAERYTVRVDGAAAASDEDGPGCSADALSAAYSPTFAAPAAFPAGEDDFWEDARFGSPDEDRATDLGTAFHRLAQHAVVSRRPAGPLEPPSADRVDAISRTCNLDAVQKARLAAALDRWFASDIAHDMASFDDLRAEVPFFLRVSACGAGGEAFLEGEIDLIGLDVDRSCAHVVDYKTGGADDEDVSTLSRKHVLQAACYAYAVMQQGISEVVADFVRVERVRARTADQPQRVSYRFSHSDIPVLAEAISSVYARARA